MRESKTSREFFESKYQRDEDPWDFASSNYEQERYTATVNALRGRRYQRAFEPGCSIGVLTERLALICDQVEAIDISPTAVGRALERCKDLSNVHIICGAFPQTIPAGCFDLVILSEIGYYFQEENLRTVGKVVLEHVAPGGILLAVHWLGYSKDHLLHGDKVHDVLGALLGIEHQHAERHDGFRLDLWIRR